MSNTETWRVRTRLKKLEDQVKELRSELEIQKIESQHKVWDALYKDLKSKEPE